MVTAALTMIMTALSPPVDAAPTATIEATPATLSVTGYGEIARAPDLATVGVAIITADDGNPRSLSQNNARFAALVTKLSALGIAAGDVQSASIASYFNPRPTSGAEARNLYGYIVTRNVQIVVRELSLTGKVVDAASAVGGGQINGVSYGFRDRPALERVALAAAVTDAYAQAQTIATAAHVRIVRILTIGYDNGAPIRLHAETAALSRTAAEPVPTTIEPTDQAISRSIAITYVVR